MTLTDSDIITQADLVGVDPEVDKTAPNESIDVPTAIRLGMESVIHTISTRYQGFSGYLMSPGSSAGHNAAVMNTYSTAVSRPRVRPNQVVGIGPDPARREMHTWIKYASLYAFYRSAYHRKIDDRYEKKMLFYGLENNQARDRLDATGLPVVLSPIPCPGAVRELNVGTWGAANVSAGGSGSTEPGGRSLDVAITWVGAGYVSAAKPANQESAGSPMLTQAMLASQVVSVNIASLNPPNGLIGMIGTADGVFGQIPATGWNVYVGLFDQVMWLQNASPIPVATKTFTLPNAPVLSGSPLGYGQFPDYNFASARMIQRS
jgi:hypothetical protein